MNQRQKQIMDYLLEHPEGASLEDLVESLKITKTAVRDHITKIEALGYLRFEDEQGSRGRPKRRYFLSESGTEAFPRQYSWLSNEMLGLIAQEMQGEGVVKFMGRLADRVSASIGSKLKSSEPASRFKEIVGMMNELGYRAQLKQSDVRKGPVIEAINCVYHTVAKQNPKLCSFDIRLLQNASGMDVKLESCIARGGTVCRFCFSKRDKTP